MSTLIAVDPGHRYFAWALFEKGFLQDRNKYEVPTHMDPAKVATALAGAYDKFPNGIFSPKTFVIERPRIYQGHKAQGTPGDNLNLTMTIGALCLRAYMLGMEVSSEVPSDWKGQVPKKIHHARIKALLVPSELDLWKGTNEHERDAIGLGLFILGRSGKGGTPR